MKKFATLLTISTTAYGLAFDGPLPTPVKDLVYAALDGYSPRPTNEVLSLPDLFRRQQKANPAICGYLDGDAEFPVSCTAGSCIYNTAQKWFGCCANGSCSSSEVITRCVNSASVSKCLEDSSCYNDAAAMACTASSAPYCVNMYAKIAEGTMSHWVCGASATSVGVLASSTVESGSVKATTVVRSGAAAGPGLNAATASGQTAAPSALSTGGAAVHRAGSMVGVAGGLVGALAVLL
ncbi:hypothetical protein CC86DRAFT_396377 [Ophiobolus disseminans]|uniref:Extracellular membrane protein CFEM domain-containing protein n=1 Tax=Ophiobolus disseminans TaxID=1469910 RepID=A0A6A6ZQR2_9PLEO|nr:hypothetical protein CC86DRAFT_396377 [Ophiobolus disseminans]